MAFRFCYSQTLAHHIEPLHHCNKLAMEPKGYEKLAKFMSDRDHVVIKKYRELAILDLLYLQAELCEIQYNLANQQKIDARETDERQYHDREWWCLQSAAERGLGGKQWGLVLTMRGKLKEYCKWMMMTDIFHVKYRELVPGY
jgi:hypothetical protein